MNILFAWTYASRFEKGALWYMIAITIVLTLVLYGISQWIWIMSVVVLLFAWVYMLHENNSPPTLRAEITDTGINTGNVFYEYARISSFTIIYTENVAHTLRIHVIKNIPPVCDIVLPLDMNIAELRAYLSTQIAEDPTEKFTFSDYLVRFLRL